MENNEVAGNKEMTTEEWLGITRKIMWKLAGKLKQKLGGNGPEQIERSLDGLNYHDDLLPTRVFSYVAFMAGCGSGVNETLFSVYMTCIFWLFKRLMWANYSSGGLMATQHKMTYSEGDMQRITQRIMDFFPCDNEAGEEEIRQMFSEQERYQKLLKELQADAQSAEVSVAQAMFGNPYLNGLFRKLTPAMQTTCFCIGTDYGE